MNQRSYKKRYIGGLNMFLPFAKRITKKRYILIQKLIMLVSHEALEDNLSILAIIDRVVELGEKHNIHEKEVHSALGIPSLSLFDKFNWWWKEEDES